MNQTSPQPRRLWPTLLVYGGVVLLFLWYGRFQTTQGHTDENYQLTTVVVTNPVMVAFVAWGMFAMAIALLIASCFSLKYKLLRWPVAGVMIAIVVYPFSGLSHVVHNLGPWTTHQSVVAKDNSRYTFLDSSFLQGQRMVIGEMTHQTAFTTTYRVLVWNHGDSPRSWASVIRPSSATPPDTYGQLYLTDQQLLLGIRYDNKCYLAYDLNTSTPYGHGEIEKLSPLACLSTGDQPNEQDIKDTCRQIEDYVDYSLKNADLRFAQGLLTGEPMPGWPSLTVVREDAQSNQPEAAALAQRLLACFEPGLPKLQARVDEEEAKTP